MGETLARYYKLFIYNRMSYMHTVFVFLIQSHVKKVMISNLFGYLVHDVTSPNKKSIKKSDKWAPHIRA